MAGRSYKDHFGNASSAFEKTLKTKEATERFSNEDISVLPIPEQEKRAQAKLEEERERKRREKEKNDKYDSIPRYGALEREAYLANKKIIEAKARKEYVEPRKQKIEKVINILSATYGLNDVKVIDITDKVVAGKRVNNALVGEDPCPKQKKEVFVKATVDGVEIEKTFIEGQKIVF